MAEPLALVGPYSPIPSADAVTFCGGIVALAKSYGVNTQGLAGDDRSQVFERKDRDGHIWFIRCVGCPLWFAFRERTEEELVELRDQQADRYFNSWFSSERLRYCRNIGNRVRWLVGELRPERGLSRQARRNFKRQLESLMEIQVDLMSDSSIKLADVRTRLEPFGLPYKR